MSWARVAAQGLGWLTTLPYRRPRSRVSLGRRILGNGRLRVEGPGRVELGDDVNAWSHAEVNHLVTTDRRAVIRIGRNARLNGCTLIAADRIEVGADCVLGSCEIRDHLPATSLMRHRPATDVAGPVVLEDNVWVGGQVSVLPGVRVGKNSVIGIQAVVFDDVRSNVIVVGNPARVVRELEGVTRDNPTQ
ncbi:MAG: acyltransferase [Candidatus Dormibacteraeota bacterium]|nr:acyltransferase [Candidatus Dormibacteraeota bacterium]